MRIVVGIIIYKSGLDILLKNIRMFSCQSLPDADRSTDVSIVILDNDDGRQIQEVREAVRKTGYAVPDIAFLASENIGFGAGHNRIFEYAKGQTDFDYYLCVNPDGIPHRGMLGELVSSARKNDDRGIFEARQFPVEHPKVYDPKTGKTEWCSACCLMFPRAVFERLGGFDDFFFMYMEDVDISWRARLLGYGCFLAQDALFFHFVEDEKRDRGRMLKNIFVSGYKLGCKYKDSAFRLYCRGELAKILTDHEMRKLDTEIKARKGEYRPFRAEKFMNFREKFYFSRVRW